jgi:flagellar basal-body rod protein FlgB
MELLGLVEKALNIRAHYHKVLAGNVANVETPHYKERELDFTKALDGSMRTAADLKVTEKTEYDGLNSTDGNTVNLENQVVKLTENNLHFNSLVRIITKKFATMRYVINEGRG